MAGIIIVNGPFGSGKTDLANAVQKELEKNHPDLAIHRVSDGPHLVRGVTTGAHGDNDSLMSSSHYHDWVTPDKPHNHVDQTIQPHFPFTVIDTEITDEMVRQFIIELWWTSQRESGLITAELGTGIAGELARQTSRVDLSSERVISIAQRFDFWPELKKRIKGVVMVETSWEVRSERNLKRSSEGDGVIESWRVPPEGMSITELSDFSCWADELSKAKIITIDNNIAINLELADIELRRRIAPVLNLLENNHMFQEGSTRPIRPIGPTKESRFVTH